MFSDLKYLKNRNIIILSIVKWGKMRVSKHHYALELASASNKVYYVEPPDILLKESFRISKSDENNNLFIITYKPVARGKRFFPPSIYRYIEWIQSKWLLNKLKIAPDILISFDPYRFSNLRWFNATTTIFFAADLYKSSDVPGEVITADLCIGVSPTIVHLLRQSNKMSYFINHGLNRAFVSLANNQLKEYKGWQKNKRITVGYIGNLLIGSLDRKSMTTVIREHPDLNFVFWGQYKERQDNVMSGGSADIKEFICFLQNSPNVELAGPKTPMELTTDILKADMFWLCYDNSYTWAVDGSNSHKILEYLATGRPIISSNISVYQNLELLYMVDSEKKINFNYFFKEKIKEIPNSESSTKVEKRIQFALSNSYSHHIYEIDKLISENTQNLID